MGATTYKQILTFGDWQYPGKLYYILTSRNLSAARTGIIKRSVEEVIEDIKSREYQRVWIVGGVAVASAFMQKQLVNEYIITIIPVILGSGISLYQSAPEQSLNLIETKAYSSDVVKLHYC
ncbi:deaminase-reductase domain-containing protein [Calothrix sp. NIES-4071]|nr:deaminase-reductase domain-containing protein [Calothrix sp. NIES-4071]BAZ57357.1 deaminase-reductase domain-containing protein [Calothrix sp. NIES-4105]